MDTSDCLQMRMPTFESVIFSWDLSIGCHICVSLVRACMSRLFRHAFMSTCRVLSQLEFTKALHSFLKLSRSHTCACSLRMLMHERYIMVLSYACTLAQTLYTCRCKPCISRCKTMKDCFSLVLVQNIERLHHARLVSTDIILPTEKISAHK
jgi:hypothetical protein